MAREEAIKVIKDNWPNGRVQIQEALETLIPELKESEDERIRKAIKLLIDMKENDSIGLEPVYGASYKEMLSWLEKQGEQKPNADYPWIKCSNELPNRDGIYLVVTDGRYNDAYDIAMYDSVEGWHKASEIIYWMPIPQLNNKTIIEQNHSWSKEDEKMWSTISELIWDGYKFSDKKVSWDKIRCWLLPKIKFFKKKE